MKITSAPLIVSMGWFSVRLIRGCYHYTLIFSLRFFPVENIIDFRYLFDQTSLRTEINLIDFINIVVYKTLSEVII